MQNPYVNVYDNSIHKHQKLEVAQIAFNGKVYKPQYILGMEY